MQLNDAMRPVLQVWRTDRIPNGNTSLTALPSTKVMGFSVSHDETQHVTASLELSQWTVQTALPKSNVKKAVKEVQRRSLRGDLGVKIMLLAPWGRSHVERCSKLRSPNLEPDVLF
jgi:hypothetical protein